MSRLRLLGSSVLIAWVALAAISPAVARPPCASQCKQKVNACRRSECAGLGSSARRACVERCRGIGGCGEIRTLAYVVTQCREDASGYSARQSLRIQRGHCEPVTVAELETPAPVQNSWPGEKWGCSHFGIGRAGYRSVWAGAFTRLGVSPDGSSVVFEVTDDFSVLPAAFPPPLPEGTYRVAADGRGLHRLGPASGARSGHFGPLFRGRGSTFDVLYRFSPDGRTIVYTDLGPGPSGEDAVQVVTLDIVTGERTQVTHLPFAVGPFGGGWPVVTSPRFADRKTIIFRTFADIDGQHPGDPDDHDNRYGGGWFRVLTDGGGLEAATPSVAITGGRVRQTFDVAAGGTNLVGVEFPQPNEPIREIFLLDGPRVLQLTNFRRVDTGDGGKILDRRAKRGYFVASADPLGTNPSHNCQLFAIDTLGGGLRQLTNFHEVEGSLTGCAYNLPVGCAIGPIFQDEVTKTILFHSSCDPFGTTGRMGGQVFSIRPDGTGLRQLTALRGVVTDQGEDGAVSVELPGPVAYSAPDGGRAFY